MNIPEALARLGSVGLSQKAIAKAVGSSQSTINRASHGKDIRFSTGALIIELAESLEKTASSADLEPILPSDSHIRQCVDTAVQASSVEVAP
ncbi:TPA: hypothetical protein ACXK46_006517 [Pseudomonas aeruginosa]